MVELKDAPALLICKTCKKLSTICADFKKKCIRADNNSKRNSIERFLWSENLSKLRVHQPVEDEIATTIETIIETPILQENEMDILQQIEEVPVMIENPLNVKNNEKIERKIDKLSCQQIEELTGEISNLLNIEFHENEQFRFIRRLTRNSNTITKSNIKNSSDNSTNQFSCTKCALKFSDAQQLSLHFARIHIYRSKRNSL